MPRRNKRDKRMDPREKRFLAGEPPELILKPQRRRNKGKTKEPIPVEESEDE